MARFHDRQRALTLRKQGQSYGQIKKKLGINKSTLSYWLRYYPLSKKRIQELRDNNEKRIEKFRETMRNKRERRLKEIYDIQKKLILPLNEREIFIAGLFLYWGEGAKYRRSSLSISNSDPAVIKFFIHWLNRSAKIPKNKMGVELHLYSDMNIRKEMEFWSRTINLPQSQFIVPYIKKTSSKKINHKGGFGHGTCNVRINNVAIAERILMSIKAIRDNYLMTGM